MIRRLVLILVVSCGSAKTRGTSGGNEPQDKKDTPTDTTPPAKVCDPFEPRIPAPELFIGPIGLEAKLVGLIGSASKTLDVLIYELGTPPILQALIDANTRGVAVRMVIDRNHNQSAKDKLTAAGVDWRPSPQQFSYAHSKTMLIDGATSVIMSANMNSYSTQGERNYGIVSKDTGDAADLSAVFEADWVGTPDAVTLPCTRLVVSPINSRSRIAQLITSTTDSLDLSVMYLADADLIADVLARKKAGVTVRALLADPQWMDGNQDTAKMLQDAGIPAKYMTALDLHAKLLLSDDRAYVGSENMSLTSLDRNREVGVFVSNVELVRDIRAQFEADWAAGQPSQ